MNRRVIVKVIGRDATRLNQLRNLLNAELAGKAVRDRPRDWVSGITPNERKLDVRFTSTADADTFYAWAVANIAAIRSRTTSGRVSVHDCSHEDVAVHSCRTRSYSEIVV